MASKVVVIGGSFAGLTAAFDLKRKLKDLAEVTVISKTDRFVFIPSLIWVPFGWREVEDISFDLTPALARRGIQFRHERAERIEAERNVVVTENSEVPYDYLVIATGPQVQFDIVPGLGSHSGGYTQSICAPDHAEHARQAWKEFLEDPGPVVVGATQGASCFGAGYEFVLNLEYALRKAGVRDKVDVTWVTAEPFLAHWGVDGFGNAENMTRAFFEKIDIKFITNATIAEVTPSVVRLGDGRELPYKYSAIIPPFLGADVVRNSPGIGNEKGFVLADDTYRHPVYRNIYSAGIATAIASPRPTPIPTGVPKTGWLSEVMAKTAVHNIVSELRGNGSARLKKQPFGEILGLCILDAGNQGIVMTTDHIFRPRKVELLIPGPWSHWAKLAFEKYYLWRMKGGHTYLP